MPEPVVLHNNFCRKSLILQVIDKQADTVIMPRVGHSEGQDHCLK